MPSDATLQSWANYDRLKAAGYNVGADPRMSNPTLARYGQSAVDRGYNTYDEGQAYNQKKARADFWKKTVLPIAAFAGGPMLAGLWSGAGAGAAGASQIGGASIPGIGSIPSIGGAAAAGGSRIGSILGSKGMDLGVNSILGFLGMRSQNKANTAAQTAALQAQLRNEQIIREQIAAEQRNADLDRTDARAAQDAMNELKRRELAASEEERSYVRRKDEDRETRLAPYRETSRQALQRLSAMWSQ